MDATTDGAGPLAAPMTIDTWLSAAQGDASGFWFQSLMAQLAFPSVRLGRVAAVGRTDAAAARQYFAAGADKGSIFAPRHRLRSGPAAGSPTRGRRTRTRTMYTRVRDSNVETLLIGGELDFATPPQSATRELLPYLPNGHQVVLAGVRPHDDFWTSSRRPARS